MSILVDENSKLLIQGITGNEGKFHGEQMINYGTKVVAGVTPGKGGETELGVPVFNSVAEAVEKTGANASVIYVPAAFAADAALEALIAGLPLVVVISEGVPTTDMLKVYWTARRKGAVVIGPNCPGIISPGKAKVGIMPGHIHKPGGVGVISRSGTLTYEVVWALTQAGIGQSTCIGIGGDPIVGTGFLDALALFKDDDETEAVILIGEIGGTEEEKAAEYIRDHLGKPACAFIAGKTAPPGKRMGHAGAIISGGEGTAQSKIAALEACFIPVAERPDAIAELVKAKIKG
jgi:succinyl-CoA synthetase alpha subunit